MPHKRLSLRDFHFQPSGADGYRVTYTSCTGRQYTGFTTDINLILQTKFEDHPKQVNLIRLKQIAKQWKQQ